MNFLYYKSNNSDFILREYGIDAKNIDTDFIEYSVLLLPHTLTFSEYQSVFYKYKNNKILFVLDFSWEPYTTLEFTKEFYRAAESVNIPYSDLLLLYNNTYQMGLHSYFYKNKVINTLSFPRWYYEYAMFLNQYPLNRMDYAEYDFTCFNYQGREHKKRTVQFIDKQELNCLATYVHAKDFKSPSVQIVDDRQTEMHLSNYYRGKINICTETLYYKDYEGWSDVICVTEKIFRNLYFGIPYVVVGNRYTLAYIKSLGFKTYDSFINESYDYQVDAYRYKQAVYTANNLLEYWDSNELTDVLEYNKQFFHNKKNADVHFENNVLKNIETFFKKSTISLI